MLHFDGPIKKIAEALPYYTTSIGDHETLTSFFHFISGDLATSPGYRREPIIVAPCQISSMITKFSPEARHHRDEYRIFIGDSPQLYAAYWEDSQSTGRWFQPFRHTLWLPSSFLANAALMDAIKDYVFQCAEMHSSNSRRVRLVVDESNASATATLAETMKLGRHPVHAHVEAVSEWEERRRGKWQHARVERDALSRPPGRKRIRYRLLEDKQLFPIALPPVSYYARGTWAAEIDVELDRTDVISNEGNRYWLPKQRGSDLAIHLVGMVARVNLHHTFVARVEPRGSFGHASEPEFQFRLYESKDLFNHLLSDSLPRHFDPNDLRSAVPHVPRYNFAYRVSKPGQDLRGLLQLFGNFHHAETYLSRNFWRNVFRWLCGSRFAKDEKIEETVEDAFQECLVREGVNKPELAEELTRTAFKKMNARIGDRYIKFLDLKARFDKALADHGEAPRQYEFGGGRERFTHAGVRALTEEEFDNQLEYLVEREIFRMGIASYCPNCRGKQWYQAKHLSQKVECSGCGQEYALQPNPEWSYKLNTLVHSAVDGNSHLAFQSLCCLATHFRPSFFHSPSLELFIPWAKESAGEIDLIFLLDGDLVFGEVKGGKPSKNELRRFFKLVVLFCPERAIVFTVPEHEVTTRDYVDELKQPVIDADIDLSVFVLPGFGTNTDGYPIPRKAEPPMGTPPVDEGTSPTSPPVEPPPEVPS